ncbi:uncharacterized protein LOC131618878 [Vicia villosa]|uniref:uncharacterized protein LOC131618878 n=1 Tax=Vicia villosa TaxID=3911 RepID=UPI00273B5DB8|nr:uncharacterized protein LOC131618878 [Vicia villosa]
MLQNLQGGGLGLRSLRNLNKDSNLKNCWDFYNEDSIWATLLRARVLRHARIISNNICSSIWSGLKGKVPTVKNNSIWLIGNGKEINFCLDEWCGPPLNSIYNIPQIYLKNLHVTVSCFIANN